MCRQSTSTILSNKITDLTQENNMLTDRVNELSRYKSTTDISLEDLQSKLDKCYAMAGEQSTVNNTLSDKLVELQTDIEDKHELINQLTNKYSQSDTINQKLIDGLKNETTALIHENTILNNNIIDLKSLLPTNTVLYYFVGSNYDHANNSLLLDLKKYFKNTFDNINIEYDETMYTTLKSIKTGKKVHKIRTSKKTLLSAYDNILRDLNNSKKIVMIGNNYGGAVINRILDKLLVNTHKISNIDFLANMFCFTFGSFYIPGRAKISKKCKKYITDSNIQNYIYTTDYSANYHVGKMPNELSDTTWCPNRSNFSKWGISTKKNPLDVHYGYDTLSIVSTELKQIKLMNS